jgi:phage terminase small subunit|tara:strand:- start:226 stop:591 length:366 start_codon:yes stop_codon:yes gene_type:complete
MTDKQDQFIENYVLTGNATKSAIASGYSERTAKVKGSQLKAQLRNEILEATQKVLADKIPEGLNWLTELAREAESESVRLGAIKDLLDRAGLKPIERIETTTVEQMSDEEIRKEIDALTRH